MGARAKLPRSGDPRRPAVPAGRCEVNATPLQHRPVANAGISYIRHRVTVRFQYNYTGRYLSSYNVRQSLLQYVSVRRTLDIKTRYSFSRNLDCYPDVTNVFNEPDSGTEFFGGRARSIKHMSPLISFGVNARM